jgi:hypothetical protein
MLRTSLIGTLAILGSAAVAPALAAASPNDQPQRPASVIESVNVKYTVTSVDRPPWAM